MSVLEGYVEGMINLDGGRGGTSDYDELENKPSINSVTLTGNKTTEDLNISYDDLQNKPTIRNVPDSSVAAIGDVLTHTASGDTWQAPETELPEATTSDAGKVLTVGADANITWETPSSSGGYNITTLWSGNAPSAQVLNLNDNILNYDELEFIVRLSSSPAYISFRVSVDIFISKFPYVANPTNMDPHYILACYDNLYSRIIMGDSTSKIYLYEVYNEILTDIRGVKFG